MVKAAVSAWQALHFRFGIKAPPFPPLAVERIAINNYFSIEKANRHLGYTPLYSTSQGMEECLPYYIELYKQMKEAAC